VSKLQNDQMLIVVSHCYVRACLCGVGSHVFTCSYLHLCVHVLRTFTQLKSFNVHLCIYIHIYIHEYVYRERERERESVRKIQHVQAIKV